MSADGIIIEGGQVYKAGECDVFLVLFLLHATVLQSSIWDTIKGPNLRIIRMEGKPSQLKNLENIFKTIREGKIS